MTWAGRSASRGAGREASADVAPLLDRYVEVIAGKAQPRAALRSLRVITQFGVTAGTLE